MDFSFVDPLRGEEWDSLTEAFPGRTVFHSSAWARTLAESYGFRPRYLAGSSGGAPAFALPLMEVRSLLTGRRGVSLPFTDLCPPLVAPGADPGELLGFVLDLAARRSWASVQLRGWPPTEGGPPASERFLHHRLPLLPDPARIRKGYNEATRRNIAHAERAGVTTRVDLSAEGVAAFRLLNRVTRRDHGLPPQPPRFFRALYRHLVAPGHGAVVLAEHAGAVVAGAVFLFRGGEAVYKYGASDRASWPLRPNNLVMDRAIRFLAERGAGSLSFGRTEPENAGLARFKRGWGASEEDLPYLRHLTREGSFASDQPQVGESAKGVFRSLPLPVLEQIGRLLYRHIA